MGAQDAIQGAQVRPASFAAQAPADSTAGADPVAPTLPPDADTESGLLPGPEEERDGTSRAGPGAAPADNDAQSGILPEGEEAASAREAAADLVDEPLSMAEPELGRNPVLEQAGFRFVNGEWVDSEGKTPPPGHLRDVVSEAIRNRAEAENWSPSRALVELYKASEGLPFDDRNNIEVAFWFLPFASAGPAGIGAVAGAVGGALAGGWEAFLAGLGLAGIISLSGDTPEEQRKDRAQAIPVPRADERSEDEPKETVTVYRVEGVKNMRIIIDDKGGVTIRLQDRRMLHLNFGSKQRAVEFLEQKIFRGDMVNPVIKQFEVRKEFLEKLRKMAIDELNATEKDPKQLLPRREDKNKAPDQFGVPGILLDELQRQIIQGTGREETPEDVGISPKRR